MVWNVVTSLIWCDGTNILSMNNNLHIFIYVDYYNEIVHIAANDI